MPDTKHIPQMQRCRSGNGLLAGWFHNETYKANIYILWSEGKHISARAAERYIRRTFDLDDYTASTNAAGTSTEVHMHNGALVHIITLHEQWSLSPSPLSILAHEVWHVAEKILSKRGIAVLPDTHNEAHAYLIESITRRLLTMMITSK